ncbi:MAG: EAL domain-containing protein [Burkholderiaceae bacterium]|nr:EAL domain-containing protein [Rhodoferax sp.]MCP5269852.1 EAL domain-containing protein [Burkholderiaceae bacterium]
MVHALVLSSTVSLLVGLALLLAWRREPALRFPLYLGSAFLWQAVAPLGFMLWRSPTPAIHVSGLALLLVSGAAALTSLVMGCAGLAGRDLGRGGRWLFLGVLVGLGALLGRGVHLPMLASALLHVAAGALAIRWLWAGGLTDRLAGVLIVALGASQMITVFGGLATAEWQATATAVVRLALGLCLIDAAMRRIAARAQSAQERFVRLIERSHQGLGIMRGETVLYMNPAACRIYGVRDVAEFASRWRDATIPAADQALARERHRRLMSGEVDHEEWEADRQRVDGKPLRLRFSAWRVDWDGAPAEQIVVSDITREHNALRERLHQATHDELTGLPNRSALLQRLHEMTPQGRPFALLVLDVDRFALVNDAHGPSTGDELLRALARRLQSVRPGAVAVMRLGEDEFALLAGADDPQAAASDLAAALTEALVAPLAAAGQAFHIDVSMGIALHPLNATDPERLLRAANAAMHEAKRVPGTAVQWAEERFERGSGTSLAAEQALRSGIAHHEFFLVYQPKVAARDGALLGFEALVRWQRGGQTISPADFIPAAERTGLIVSLGREVLVAACRQQARWRAEGRRLVPVAVNVSRWQLRDPDFAATVVQLLDEHGLSPADLIVEITETAAMNDLDAIRAQLVALHEAGVRLSLDDFGSGLSSLTTLRSLPLTEVKLDRGLVEPLPQAEAKAVVQAVCALAAALRLEVVAEGVESPAQVAAASTCGCQALQGFLFARPLDAEAAGGWLAAGGQPAAAA